jgi:ribosome maturation factor RimP
MHKSARIGRAAACAGGIFDYIRGNNSPIGPGATGCLEGVGQRPTFCFSGEHLGRNRHGLQQYDRIATLIEPSLDAMGYRLVRVQMSGGRRPTLQIMAERRDDAAMTVDDCADISRSVSAILDVADPIPGEYSLEVSSPGIDRPLVKREDFARFAGYEARIELNEPIEGGRKRFRGKLLGIEGDEIRMTVEDGGEVAFPFAAVHRAKLVLTDELLAAAQKQQADG